MSQFKFKDYIFKNLLPFFFQEKDTYLDAEGKGILERFMEVCSGYFDTDIIEDDLHYYTGDKPQPGLDNILNLIDVDETPLLFLNYLWEFLGEIPLAYGLIVQGKEYNKRDLSKWLVTREFININPRILLRYCISLYKIRGTARFYEILGKYYGLDLTLVETYPGWESSQEPAEPNHDHLVLAVYPDSNDGTIATYNRGGEAVRAAYFDGDCTSCLDLVLYVSMTKAKYDELKANGKLERTRELIQSIVDKYLPVHCTIVATIFVLDPASHLTVSPATLEMPYGGGSGSITITSDDHWTIQPVDGITFSKYSGTGNDTVNYSMGENPDTEPRTFKVYIQSDHEVKAVLNVIQEGYVYIEVLEIDPTSWDNISAAGANKTFEITANVDWSYTVPAWCTATKESDTSLKVVVSPNTSANTRTGTIVVSGGSLQVSATISQEAPEPEDYLTVTPNSGTIDYEGGNFEFTVDSSLSWTAEFSQSWGTVSILGNKVKITAGENPGSLRSGILTVRTTTGGLSENRTVTQSAQPPTPKVNATVESKKSGTSAFNFFDRTPLEDLINPIASDSINPGLPKEISVDIGSHLKSWAVYANASTVSSISLQVTHNGTVTTLGTANTQKFPGVFVYEGLDYVIQDDDYFEIL